MSSAKCRPFCLGLNVLSWSGSFHSMPSNPILPHMIPPAFPSDQYSDNGAWIIKHKHCKAYDKPCVKLLEVNKRLALIIDLKPYLHSSIFFQGTDEFLVWKLFESFPWMLSCKICVLWDIIDIFHDINFSLSQFLIQQWWHYWMHASIDKENLCE